MSQLYDIADPLLVVAFATQFVMLGLQASALRRHGHRSFLLLSVATLCGIASLTVGIVLEMRGPHTPAVDIMLYYLSAAFLVLQMILGVWGTASLFRSYRMLASADGQTHVRRGSGA